MLNLGAKGSSILLAFLATTMECNSENRTDAKVVQESNLNTIQAEISTPSLLCRSNTTDNTETYSSLCGGFNVGPQSIQPGRLENLPDDNHASSSYYRPVTVAPDYNYPEQSSIEEDRHTLSQDEPSRTHLRAGMYLPMWAPATFLTDFLVVY